MNTKCEYYDEKYPDNCGGELLGETAFASCNNKERQGMNLRKGIWQGSETNKYKERIYINTGIEDKNDAEEIFNVINRAKIGKKTREEVRKELNKLSPLKAEEIMKKVDKIVLWHVEEEYKLKHVWEIYERKRDKDITDHEVSRKRTLIKMLNKFYTPEMPIRELTPQLADKFCDHIKSMCNSPKTYKNKIGHLSSVFNRILVAAALPSNPFQTISRPTEDKILKAKKNSVVFTVNEMKRQLKEAYTHYKHLQLYELIMFGYYTKLRLSDVRQLKEENIVTIINVKGEKHRIIDTMPGKTQRFMIEVQLPIHEALAPVIDHLLASKRPDDKLLTAGSKDWPSKHSVIKPFCASLGIYPKENEYISYHSYRHTANNHQSAFNISKFHRVKFGGWTENGQEKTYLTDFTDEINEMKKMPSIGIDKPLQTHNQINISNIA